MTRQLYPWAACDNEPLRGGFVLQLRCPENRGVDPETGFRKTTGNPLNTVSVAGQRQVCDLSLCSVDRLTTASLKSKEQVAPRS